MKHLLKHNSFFLLGIKGVAMANIASMLKQINKQVIGSDTTEEFITDELLSKWGIRIFTQSDSKKQINLDEIDVFIYSAAHNGMQNPIIQEAIKKKKCVLSQAECIEELRNQFPVSVAVAGCHGKTTTSSILAYCMNKLELNPSYLIGAPTFQGTGGGIFAKNSRYFIFEADEYAVQPPFDMRPKLMFYHPTHIICTNIDYDHPDVYRSIEDVKKTFLSFFSQSLLYLCADDPHLASLFSNLNSCLYKTFGFNSSAQLRVDSLRNNQSKSTFNVSFKGKKLGAFTIGLFGEKNISNTAGVILFLLELGIDVEKIKSVLRSFTHVKRRYEVIFQKNSTILYDDYAHHPAEISATISALRNQYPKKRILLIFQPHTYSRTQSLKSELVYAVSMSDYAFIAPIFPSARELKHNFKIDSYALNEEVQKKELKNVMICGSKNEILKRISEKIKPKDVIITMGAGDIYKLKNDIIRIIKSKV